MANGNEALPFSRITTTVSMYILVIIFGLSSWITLNGVFSMVPIFMQSLPEQKNIVTYMAIVLQFSNFFPIAHLLLSMLIPDRLKHTWDTVSVYAILLTGIICSLLLGFFWNHTIVTSGGTEVSFWFFVFIFLNGAVDCTTTVVYYPLISNYLHKYTSALNVGEGMTGMITGILASIQQPGLKQPVFSVTVMCTILCSIIVASMVAFTIFRFTRIGKSQLMNRGQYQDLADAIHESNGILTDEHINNHVASSSSSASSLHQNDGEDNVEAAHAEDSIQVADPAHELWKLSDTVRLAGAEGLISMFQNGILISTSSYIFPYYPSGYTLMSYAINLSLIADPVCCFISYIIQMFPRVHSILLPMVHILWLSGGFVQIVFAFLGSHAPLTHSMGMGIVLVVIRIITNGSIAFAKTSEFGNAHKKLERVAHGSDVIKIGKHVSLGAFRITGISIQLSALVGAIFMLVSAQIGLLK